MSFALYENIREELDSLGVATHDNEGNERPVKTVIKEAREEYEKLSKQRRTVLAGDE